VARELSSLLFWPRSLVRGAGRWLKSLGAGAHPGTNGVPDRAASAAVAAVKSPSRDADAVEVLFDAAFAVPGVDVALLALVDREAGRAEGWATRGADEEWWGGVSLDLENDVSGIVAAARDGAPFTVYDLDAGGADGALEPLGARSAVFVPLVARGRVGAVLVAACRDERRYFPREAVERLADAAQAAASTVAQRRSADSLAVALGRERLIAEIGRKVRSELDLDKVLEIAVGEVGRALAVARVVVRLGSDGPMPVAAEWRSAGVGSIVDEAERLPVSNLAVRERRTVTVADVVTAPELDDPALGGRETLLDANTRAALATPIVVFDELIGVFVLHRAQPGAWSDGEIALAEAVAGEAGLAIHAARLLRADARRLERQNSLLTAAQVVTSDLRFESVLRRLVDQVANLLDADAADCWMFEQGHGLLRCRAVHGLPSTEVGRRIKPEGTMGEAVRTGRPAVNRAFAATEDPPPSPSYASFGDVMVAPITWLGEVRGVLGICALESGHFDDTDLEIVDAYARFASLAFHNAESFEERERQAQIQQGFYRIAEVLGSPLSLAETVDALAEAAAGALGGVAGFVLEPLGNRLLLAGSHDVRPVVRTALEDGISDDEAPFAAAAREERIVTSSRLTDDDRFSDRWRALFLGDADARALLATPVAVSAGRSGAVVVVFAEERTFSDEDLALARHLSRAARGALERGELFETERRARRLSQRLAAIGASLVTNLDPLAVLEDLVREAPALLEAEAVTIRLFDGDELVVRAASGGDGTAVHELVGSREPVGAGVVGSVVQSRAAMVVVDAAADRDASRGDALLGSGMGGCVAVPMGGRTGLLGVLTVYSAAPRVWREEETQALAALAVVASAAFSNAELYQQVAEEQERSSAILRNIADGIVAVDRDGTVVLWNATAERVTGVPPEEAHGRRVRDLLGRDLAEEDGPVGREEPATIARGGKDVFLAVTQAVMTDAGGNVAGRIFAFRDVSSERMLEQMKSDFVATVSHELRTPLTSIYGFAETLLRSDVEFSADDRATFLAYVVSESERLIDIVDNLLNVARLEAGTFGLDLSPTDVAEVVGEVVERVRDMLDGQFELAAEVGDGPLLADADREKLEQIVHHLVENAVKFSPDGGAITVSARRRADVVEVRVRDEGIGIPHVDQARIFTKFYRAETPVATGSPGTGLGLFLARGLVTAMGGRITVDSVEGQGSTFTVELPVSKAAPVGKDMAVEAARS